MFNNLISWLDYIQGLHENEIHLGIRRINKVFNTLNIKVNAKIITVAGTNGKGTVCTLLSNIYQAAGYNVGLYTSPHLFTFNERIKINNKNINDQDFCHYFSVIEKCRNHTYLSTFEWLTLAALLYFYDNDLDLIILEVGMGGRLDATNIIDSHLAIITTIHYDHEKFLGHDLEAIAFEKFGVIKKNTKFIWGENKFISSAKEWAKSFNCQGYFYKEDYDLTENKFMAIDYKLTIPKNDWHQSGVAHAIMAVIALNDILPVDLKHIILHIANKNLLGRQQEMIVSAHNKKIKMIVDVAHNLQSANYLYNNVVSKFNTDHSNNNLHIIFSCLDDKNIENILYKFKNLHANWYIINLMQYSKRALSVDKISSILNKYDMLKVNSAHSIEEAMNLIGKLYNENDLVIAFGSFYLIGPLLQYLNLQYFKEMKWQYH